MSITRNEIDSFHRFAAAKLENGGVQSLEEVLRQWRAARYDEETIESIRRGLEQANAGQLRPFDEVDAEIRAKYGISVDE